jgi:hypothetical protein
MAVSVERVDNEGRQVGRDALRDDGLIRLLGGLLLNIKPRSAPTVG